jgi:hypothetical protein
LVLVFHPAAVEKCVRTACNAGPSRRFGMPKEQIPLFQSDEEEARWFADHDVELDPYFEVLPPNPVPLAERLGLPPRKKPPTKAISIRISEDDLAKAQAIAEKKGIGYQTLLKMGIHEWLEQPASEPA